MTEHEPSDDGRTATPSMRFDVVVWNYQRLGSFLRNFGRIRNFDPGRDRVTVVSCSPSEEETGLVRAFEREHGFGIRYLTRHNLGREQLARLEYFTGGIGTVEENLSHRWLFQMQDHYLDPELPASRWDARFDFRIKGDVVPDDVVFDLDRMERLAEEHSLDGFVADRNRPCFIEWGEERFIAPNGSNFTLRTQLIRDPEAQANFQRMMAVFEDIVPWLTYVEYKWGPIFFREGRRFYDLARERLFSEFRLEDFYVAPDDYGWHFRMYERPAFYRTTQRVAEQVKGVARQLRASLSR